MNLKLTAKLLMVSIILSLLLYGLSSTINSYLGWEHSLLNEAWQMIALAIAFSLLAGYSYPFLRGIKKGDSLMAFTKRVHHVAGHNSVTNSVTFVHALQDGKQGEKIMVRFSNGLQGEGVIQSYSQFLIPPRIKIIHSETPTKGEVVFG